METEASRCREKLHVDERPRWGFTLGDDEKSAVMMSAALSSSF